MIIIVTVLCRWQQLLASQPQIIQMAKLKVSKGEKHYCQRRYQKLNSLHFSRYITECHRKCADYEETKMDRRPRETAQLGHSIYSQVLEARSRWKIGRFRFCKFSCRVWLITLHFTFCVFQFLYVNQTFAPSPDQTIKNLYECYGTNGKLILYYCKSQAWG